VPSLKPPKNDPSPPGDMPLGVAVVGLQPAVIDARLSRLSRM